MVIRVTITITSCSIQGFSIKVSGAIRSRYLKGATVYITIDEANSNIGFRNSMEILILVEEELTGISG